jgi:Ca2+/H+ antiporter, TMEM165/GDT1 family
MEAFLWSAGVVALGEMGDKTQLLALLLATRFKRPWAIVAGIAVATLVNHALAGLLGHWIAQQLGATTLRWVVGLGFIAMAVWMLVPDRIDDADAGSRSGHWGVFATTAVAFFLAEMGDKTQLATVALAARFADLPSVVAGTTVGLLLADVPVVWLGDVLSRRLPMTLLHRLAALLMALMGALALANVGGVFAQAWPAWSSACATWPRNARSAASSAPGVAIAAHSNVLSAPAAASMSVGLVLDTTSHSICSIGPSTSERSSRSGTSARIEPSACPRDNRSISGAV